jgi:HPt (histidine-containing phosphotransfer) domain-containing protein
MYASQFQSRLATVRQRFAVTLESKIRDTMESVQGMSGSDDVIASFVRQSYRNLHAICGVGATVGFPATGEAAQAAEIVLIGPLRDKRRLSEEETESLVSAIAQLQLAAASELRSMYQRGG